MFDIQLRNMKSINMVIYTAVTSNIDTLCLKG